MAFLKFNKAELVNLSYSLKREIISASKLGAYCNTSILTCNTRRYHGLLALTLDRFGGDRYLMLSSMDETLIVNGKQFNLGIHCYGDIYEPRGHKYIVDFNADVVPQITYKVGEILFRKSLLLRPDRDQLLVKYELLEAPSDAVLQLRPFLPFRNVHALTHVNDVADPTPSPIDGGQAFCLYEGFPELFLQFDKKADFVPGPYWNRDITYSNEYRRGYECKEDILVPGYFTLNMKEGGSVIFSASKFLEKPKNFASVYNEKIKTVGVVENYHDQLVRCADFLVTNHNSRKRINAGYSWLYTGLLRETLLCLPGLTLYAGRPEDFEEILDNLISDEKERLFHRTTQVEAPLYMASVLQKYIEFGADEKEVWKKYGPTVKGVLESYLPGVRKEVAMQPNGLLWAQQDGVALTWMNTYVNGRAVTERAGFQVETNAFWYNSICFALEMERKFGKKGGEFVSKWQTVADLVKKNFQPVFWMDRQGYLADHVDNNGQSTEIRPGAMFAIWVKYSPIDDELHPSILRVIENELVTARGIRTLSPRDINYKGVYEGSQVDRDLAYYNGCTRPGLLEQYIELAFRMKGASFVKKAEWLLEGFYEDLNKHGVGAFSELYDGDPPFEPHGAISSALSTSALLVAESLLNKYKKEA